MTRDRLSIGGLMGLVAVAALGIVGLKEGTEVWASATFTLTVLILLGAIVTAASRRGPARAARGGFALFGWAYLLLAFRPGGADLKPPPLLSARLLDELQARVHPPPQMVPNPQYTNPSGLVFLANGVSPYVVKPGAVVWQGSPEHFQQVGHCFIALLFAALGALWSRYAYAGPEHATGRTTDHGAPQPPSRP